MPLDSVITRSPSVNVGTVPSGLMLRYPGRSARGGNGITSSS